MKNPLRQARNVYQLIRLESSSKNKYLDWSVEVLPGEAHDDERESSHAVKCPLSEAEVVNQCVNIGWDDVTNRHNALKERQKLQLEFCVSLSALSTFFYWLKRL